MGSRPGRATGSLPCRVVVLPLAILTWAARAHSQPGSLDLEWNAPPECPSRQAVREEVVRVVGHAVAGAGAHAHADVSREEGGEWMAVVSIESRGTTSERHLEAASCTAIASATAVIVAVAVERGLPPEAQLSTEPDVTRHVASSAKVKAVRPESKLLVGAGAIVDAATMPTLAGGAEASLGWLLSARPFRVRVLGTGVYFPHASQYVRPDIGADFDLAGAAGRACVTVAVAPFEMGPCAGVEYDFMRAFNVKAPEGRTEKTAGWWSLLGSLVAEWKTSRVLSLSARADALVALSQPLFAVHATQPGVRDTVVHRPYSWPIRATFGVEMHFF